LNAELNNLKQVNSGLQNQITQIESDIKDKSTEEDIEKLNQKFLSLKSELETENAKEKEKKFSFRS